MWAEALANSRRGKLENSVYRLKALSVFGAFGVTSDEAALVADMIPADILAKEMSALYHARRMERHTECSNVARSESDKMISVKAGGTGLRVETGKYQLVH